MWAWMVKTMTSLFISRLYHNVFILFFKKEYHAIGRISCADSFPVGPKQRP